MKFAHLADVHIGAWRDPRLADLPDAAFEEAVSVALAEKVDFILIAGDLFHTALPGIQHLRAAVRTLQAARSAGVPVYLIPGSHDFSPSGRSMLHVLEEAGLVRDVFAGEVVNGRLQLSLTEDSKTGVLITGILGRRGMLDRQEYEDLDRESLAEAIRGKEAVFMFHTALEELRPKGLHMEAWSVSLLPKGFSYYAGGHVHITEETKTVEDRLVVYPGPLFPASFSELEELREGGFVIVDDGRVRRVPVRIRTVVPFSVKINHFTPQQVTDHLLALDGEVEDAIVLLRVSGVIKEGSAADVAFRRVIDHFYQEGAHAVLRNTVALSAESLESEAVEPASVEVLEEEVFRRAAGKASFSDDEVALAKSLLRVLSQEKGEGETNHSYEERVSDDAKRVLGLE